MLQVLFLSLLLLANYAYTADANQSNPIKNAHAHCADESEYIQLPDLDGLMHIHRTLNNTHTISFIERAVFIDIANTQISRSNFEESIDQIIKTKHATLLSLRLMSAPNCATRAKTTLLSLKK